MPLKKCSLSRGVEDKFVSKGYLAGNMKEDDIVSSFSCQRVVHRGMEVKEKRGCWWVPVEVPKQA